MEVNTLADALAAWKLGKDFALAVLPEGDGENREPSFFLEHAGILTNANGDRWIAEPFDDAGNLQDYTCSREEHVALVGKAISAIESNDFQKVVLSRMKPHTRVPRSKEDTLVLWQKLVAAYPHAFVYLMVSKQWGTWLGATPERLVVKKHGIYHTVSLAGTQRMPTGMPIEAVKWGNKEKEEQAVVTQFICEALSAGGFSGIQCSEPFSQKAGPVVHLKTEISFSGEKKLHEVIRLLHPTPAVCGLPRENALQFIRSHEQHGRQLYAGPIGIQSATDEHNVYVNLRCMRIEETTDWLYVGGGIMRNSVPELEWEETENKAQTLLAIMKS